MLPTDVDIVVRVMTVCRGEMFGPQRSQIFTPPPPTVMVGVTVFDRVRVRIDA